MLALAKHPRRTELLSDSWTDAEGYCCLLDVAQQVTRTSGFISPGFKAVCSSGFCHWVAEGLLSGGGWQVSAERSDQLHLAGQSPGLFHF